MKLNYNKYFDKLNKLNSNEKKIYINNLREYFLDCHNITSDGSWYDKFLIDVNYSMFQHGLIRNQGYRDYLVIDYLKENLYLCEDREMYRLIENSSFIELGFNESLNIEKPFSNEYGDFVKDYVDLNLIAFYDKELARAIVKTMGLNFRNITFAKLFKIYTAKFMVDILVQKDKIKDEETLLIYNNFIDFIYEEYEDFTKYKPNWVGC